MLIVVYLKIVRGLFRALFRFCPNCNTTAPDLYSCEICKGEQYPRGMNAGLKGYYLWEYKRRLWKGYHLKKQPWKK